MANAAAVLTFCVLGCFWFYAGKRSDDQLLLLGALFVISILPIYRRTNDLGLLVLPLMWGIRNRRHWAGLFVAACAAMFFIPMNSILARLEIYGMVSGLQSWLVLAMAIVSIYALWESSQVATAPPQLSSRESHLLAPSSSSAQGHVNTRRAVLRAGSPRASALAYRFRRCTARVCEASGRLSLRWRAKFSSG